MKCSVFLLVYTVLLVSVLEVFSLSISYTVLLVLPATGFVDNLRFLRPVEAIFITKEILNSASVLKNNPEVDETIKLSDKVKREQPHFLSWKSQAGWYNRCCYIS